MPGIEGSTTGKVTISVNLNKQKQVRVATISETPSNTSRPTSITRMKVQALVFEVLKPSEDNKAKVRKSNHCVKSVRI